MAIEKIRILGAVLELPAKQRCQLSPFGPFSWWIFSMAMVADHNFQLISIETCAPQFKWLNKSFLGSVIPWLSLKMMTNDVCVSSFVHAAFVMPLSVGGRPVGIGIVGTWAYGNVRILWLHSVICWAESTFYLSLSMGRWVVNSRVACPALLVEWVGVRLIPF